MGGGIIDWEIYKRVWRGKGWPRDWREGIIVPIRKKRESERQQRLGRETVDEYRGVTLTQTAYRVYASVLAERVKKEVEKKGILPTS